MADANVENRINSAFPDFMATEFVERFEEENIMSQLSKTAPIISRLRDEEQVFAKISGNRLGYELAKAEGKEFIYIDNRVDLVVITAYMFNGRGFICGS